MNVETTKLPPRVSVDLSPQLNARLEEITAQHHLSKVDVIRRAFALYDMAVKAKDNGERMGFFDENGNLVREIVSIV
jgi:predicted transcriptional regulator